MKAFILIIFAIFIVSSFASLRIGVKYRPENCEEKTKRGSRVKVHYTGTLKDGTKFDSSLDRGDPFEFTIGAGQVIKGWDNGLIGACVGEKRRLTIPPELGYGSQSMGKIPSNSVLIFEIEVVEIN
eukprot:TRINITY_DN11465_c0_g1_i1.p1 TRINITY_DN11465_c0_g1~~TRINITY_DN11465_c0_g1_i1.p1  ORF type:complete len:126 (+),score=35.69 TRINITY_DN11465_c0_g1_i1:1-378(+)